MAEKRILGVDLGDKRTGVAISDLSGTLAVGLELVEEQGLMKCVKKIADICAAHDIGEIVLGYPLNMNGTRGESAVKIEKFKEVLEDMTGINIILYDERLSTSLAHVYLNQTGAKKRREKVDMLAACIILQDYMDSRKK